MSSELNFAVVQAVWTFPLALMIVLVSLAIFTPIIRRARERRYAIREAQGSDRASIAKQFEIPEIQPETTSIATSLEELYRPVAQVHKTANRYQQTYHNRVARCVICLAIALIALGLSLTVFHDEQRI